MYFSLFYNNNITKMNKRKENLNILKKFQSRYEDYLIKGDLELYKSYLDDFRKKGGKNGLKQIYHLWDSYSSNKGAKFRRDLEEIKDMLGITIKEEGLAYLRNKVNKLTDKNRNVDKIDEAKIEYLETKINDDYEKIIENNVTKKERSSLRQNMIKNLIRVNSIISKYVRS